MTDDTTAHPPGMTDQAFRRSSLMGTQLEPSYSGAQSFMRRRYSRDLTGVDIAVLLDKRMRRQGTLDADFVGFDCPDYFVVGYGMDVGHAFRELPFVGIVNRQTKTAAQLVGEALAARGHGMRVAAERQRPSDNQRARLPFLDQGTDCGEARGIGFAMNGGQGMCLSQLPLADRNADPFFTEVESEDGASPCPVRLRHGRLGRQDW